MRRRWKGFILLAALLVVAVAAGQFVTMAVLTILLPVYALLLASIFLILFIAMASVVVPIGQAVLDRRESRAQIHAHDTQPRKAA